MKPTLAALQKVAPEVPGQLIGQHLSRLDNSYFRRFDLDTVAEHIRGLADLSPLLAAAVLVRLRSDGLIECTVLSFDAPGLFSTVTGTLMSLGFSITSGDVYTYGPAASGTGNRPRGRPSDLYRRRIVDYFVGHIPPSEALPDWANRLRERLVGTVALLQKRDADSAQDARRQVNEWVTGRLEVLGPARPRSPFATEVHFRAENDHRLHLRVESEDTPAFLYSLSTALALHDISIVRVRIETVRGQVHDDLTVELPATDSRRDWEDDIRTAVLLTKQFTYFLDSAPDPYAALTRFDWLASHAAGEDHRPDWVAILANPGTMPYLARLLGASDFLWEDFIRQRYGEVLTTLREQLEGGARRHAEGTLAQALKGLPEAEQRRVIANYRDRQAFLIQLDGILDPGGDPHALSRRLTALAEELTSVSVRLIFNELAHRMGVPDAAYGVFALGKFGGAALGYASDLEVLLVYEGVEQSAFFATLLEELQAHFRGKQEGLFELDLRLRPWGKNAALECPVATFEAYYGPQGEAHSLERIALTRLRFVAGDPAFGEHVAGLRDRFVYEEAWLQLDELAETRDRQYRQKQAGTRNAKYSPGALVDIEYAVQILQVKNGRELPALRTTDLDAAIDGLGRNGVIESAQASKLAAAYSHLRRLINALRMLRGIAEDLELPHPESTEARHLARRMGYHEPDWALASADLERDFATQTGFVREFVRRYVGEALLPTVRRRGATARG